MMTVTIRQLLAILFLIGTLVACKDSDSAMTPQSQAQQDAQLPAASLPAGFTSQTATVNGVRLHYVIGGQGEPLVLLHGWPETWYEWHRVMPTLAQRYTVIAPDLRGIGESDKTLLTNGFDKKRWLPTCVAWCSSWAIRVLTLSVTTLA